jgi:putative oxidoreductase
MNTATVNAVGDAPTAAALPGYAVAALAGRILIAPVFLLSGVAKLSAPVVMMGAIQAAGLPVPLLALGVATAIELLGGFALLLGFRTRIAATILAIFCLVTALAFHSHFADQNQFTHFFKNLAMAGGLLQIVAFGGGRFSLDARRR